MHPLASLTLTLLDPERAADRRTQEGFFDLSRAHRISPAITPLMDEPQPYDAPPFLFPLKNPVNFMRIFF
jgi:hypothetical protein